MLPFSRRLAAAALESAFFSPAVWVFFGLQLPLVMGFLPGTGSKPGQQGLALFFADFFAADVLAADFVAAGFFAVVISR